MFGMFGKSSDKKKETDKKQEIKDEPILSQEGTSKDVARAEQKVAQGVQKIYQKIVKKYADDFAVKIKEKKDKLNEKLQNLKKMETEQPHGLLVRDKKKVVDFVLTSDMQQIKLSDDVEVTPMLYDPDYTHEIEAAIQNELKNADQELEDFNESVRQGNLDAVFPYDAQGIAKIELSPDELKEMSADFPNGLKNGMHVIFFKKGFVQHPAVQDMIQEKIRSLCNAAVGVRIPVDGKGEVKDEKEALKILNLLNPEDASKIQKQMFKKLAEKLGTLPQNSDELNAKAIELMEEFIIETLTHLYQKIAQDHFLEAEGVHLTRASFVERVFKYAQSHRSSESDVLTFDSTAGKFSYDEGASTTSQDRGLDKTAANLSWTCEGLMIVKPDSKDEKKADITGTIKCKATSSILKHASLAPLDAIKKKKDPIDILVATYKNMREVVEKQAQIRQHGGQKPPFTVDWNYHLLTSNKLNQENQKESYENIVRAGRFLNGLTFDAKGMGRVTAKVHVMNVGINFLTGEKLTDKFKREVKHVKENRKSYMHLSDSLPFSEMGGDFKKLDAKILECYVVMKPAQDIALKSRIDGLQKDIIQNNQRFEILVNEYVQAKASYEHQKKTIARIQKAGGDSSQIKRLESAAKTYKKQKEEKGKAIEKLIKQNKKLNSDLCKVQEQIEIQRKKQLGYDLKDAKMPKEIKSFIDYVKTSSNLTKDSTDYKGSLAHLSAILQDEKTPAENREKAEEYVRSIMAQVCKAYMDELYYTGRFQQNPTLATIFHTYCMAYEILSDMMASTGCKSANDRTYVMRLFLAAFQGEPLEKVKIPGQLDHSPEEYAKLMKELNKIAMSNSAGFATCRDGSGGWPKVSTVGVMGEGTNNFEQVEAVTALKNNHSMVFGDFAAAKLAKKIPKYTDKLRAKITQQGEYNRKGSTDRRATVLGSTTTQEPERTTTLRRSSSK